jgi:tetratricopeptide (TPR) repeat protein
LALIENESDDNIWPKYNEELMKISEPLTKDADQNIRYKGLKGLGDALNNQGFIYNIKGDIPKALEYFEKSLKLQEEIGYKVGIAELLSNIGVIYYNQNEKNKALDYYKRSLKIREELGDKDGIANSLNNIGSVYYDQKDMHKALAYYGNSLKIQEEIGDKLGYAYSLNNIGSAYFNQGDVLKALDYFSRSLEVRESIKDHQGIVASLHNLGAIYLKLSSIKDPSLTKQAHVRFKPGKLNNLKLAYQYSDSSLILSKKLGLVENVRNAERMLSRIDSAMGNEEGALLHFKKYILYRDSIVNQETQRASIKNHLKYEYEKKEAILKEQQEKEKKIAHEKERFQQIIIFVVVLGLILVLVFAFFVFRSLKTTRFQKMIIEEKQREILDSIHYAKKIQTALMSNENYVSKNLKRLQDPEKKNISI